MPEHEHVWEAIVKQDDLSRRMITIICPVCNAFMRADEIQRRLNATERLKKLAKDIQSGEADGPVWRNLVPEEQRGEIAKHSWNDSMFVYGMEYGVLAAFALEGKDAPE